MNVAFAAVADAELTQLDIKEVAHQQILCPQVQQLLHSPDLKIGFKPAHRPLVVLPHRQQVFDHLHWTAHPGGH
jgi:hypothetical protein